MWEFHSRAQAFLDNTVKDEAEKAALQAYLDYVIKEEQVRGQTWRVSLQAME